MASEDIRVPVLTKSNYQRWKYEVTSYLESVGVFDIVSGAEPCPNSTTHAKEAKEWRKGDARAKRILTGGLSDDDHASIRKCEFALEIWETIKSLYEAKTETNKYLLGQALHAPCTLR